MSDYAPVEVTLMGTDDELFAFTRRFEMEDGSPFPFSDYAIEYSLRGECGHSFTLDQTHGISLSDAYVTFTRTERVPPGRYEHGCRIKHLLTGTYFQVFDGPVFISQGNFA
jgi:hypothetical protein